MNRARIDSALKANAARVLAGDLAQQGACGAQACDRVGGVHAGIVVCVGEAVGGDLVAGGVNGAHTGWTSACESGGDEEGGAGAMAGQQCEDLVYTAFGDRAFGVAIEGAHQNFWAVIDGTVVTHPATNLILAGITRGVVLELARAAGMRVAERAIQLEEIGVAEELFFTGATGEVRPCVQVDGKPVGDGRVGPVTRALSDAFLKLVERTKREGRRSTKETAAIAR